MSIHSSRGSTFASALSVFSGVGAATSPSRLEMRCTWVSTQIAGIPKPSPSTRLAVLRPTPGSSRSAASDGGTSPP